MSDFIYLHDYLGHNFLLKKDFIEIFNFFK